jgi:superfamily I DNA and/or RNA helicase
VDLQRAIFSEANVIGATCSGIAGAKDFDGDFDCVIVDEAGRTTPLDLLMPIVRGKSIVLVGDHKQLPPFIGEEIKEELTDIEKSLVERSLFEDIYDVVPRRSPASPPKAVPHGTCNLRYRARNFLPGCVPCSRTGAGLH